MPDSDVPLNVQLPASGLSKPVRRLKSVVFPAPFGPMSAVMAPRGISRCSTSTAVRPPNVRRTPSMTMIGSTFATPGTASPVCSPTVFSRATGAADALLDKGQLLLVAEHALGSEDHQ